MEALVDAQRGEADPTWLQEELEALQTSFHRGRI
jgi:hypothetical protein